MKKKLLKQLALASYTGNFLNEEKVQKIVNFLTRKELKEYIRELKTAEQRITVTIQTPSEHGEERYGQLFKPLFPEKKVKFRQDPSLLLGIRIINNDLVTDINFQNSLRQIQAYIEETV